MTTVETSRISEMVENQNAQRSSGTGTVSLQTHAKVIDTVEAMAVDATMAVSDTDQTSPQAAAETIETGPERAARTFTTSSSDPGAEQSQGIAEMFAAAHANAPRSGGIQLQWMTISQAAAALRMSKNVLSSMATRGLIASVKCGGANQHRLVHIDNVLHYLADSITSGR